MNARTLDLASLIGSRICHDLINPIGAINNGLELMALDGVPHGPEMALIAESVENANARIRFFRVSYGVTSDTQSFGKAEIRSILDGLAPGARVAFEWTPAMDVPRQEVQLVFLAMQCLETALPFNGTISVAQTASGWQVCGTSERVKRDDALWSALRDSAPNPDIIPSQVQFALLPMLLAERGRMLEIREEPNRITLAF